MKHKGHLRLIDPETGEVDPKEGWIVNNQFLYSDDNFQTSKSVFREYTIEDQNHWGLIADAMIAGYIESTTIVGGTINIGDGTFVVASDGSVTMKASSIDGYVTDSELSDVESDLSSRITINENNITTKVSKDSVISSINQSAESITINSNRISLAGKTIDLTSDIIAIDSTHFSVTAEGKITATSGEIAGWSISDNLLQKELRVADVDYQIYMQAADGVNNTNVFAVSKKGVSNITWDIQFSVDYTGKLIAKNVDIEGKISASSGIVGGWNIASNSLTHVYNGYGVGFCNKDSATNIIAAGIPVGASDDITTMSWEDAPFRVGYDGSLYCSNATITGSSTIAEACIPNLSASKITSGTISTDRLSSSVITTSNFSEKTLSTANLTIKSGCVIGATTYNATIDNRDGYVYIAAAGPTSYGATIHEIVKQTATNGSSREIKNEIHDFDERYNTFFDKLKPQLYKYNFDPNEGYSMGYIWQEVEESLSNSNLTRNDVGALYESAAVEGGLGLRKTDFIALNTWQIQKLKARVEELEKKLAALES